MVAAYYRKIILFLGFYLINTLLWQTNPEKCDERTWGVPFIPCCG
jgi:hypothetical protein